MRARDHFEYPRGRLLIFAKAPLPGRVKTRLAGHFGKRGAARLYRRAMRRTLATALSSGVAPVRMWCAPDGRHPRLAALSAMADLRRRRQPPGDLGRRMHLASRAALSEADAVVIIGADCAPVTPAMLRSAFQALAAGADLVLGPAEDGGYVLIGLRRPVPALFSAMPWGGASVLRATRHRARRRGLRWLELPVCWDIDRPADVRRARRQGLL